MELRWQGKKCRSHLTKTMTVFCMTPGLGANLYVVSRALGMVATPLLSALLLGSQLTLPLWLSAACVALGALLFSRCRPEGGEEAKPAGPRDGWRGLRGGGALSWALSSAASPTGAAQAAAQVALLVAFDGTSYGGWDAVGTEG